MQRGPWWQTGSVLAPSLRTEWCWGTDRSRAPMERPLVRGAGRAVRTTVQWRQLRRFGREA